jgi:hypothetical protein
MNRTAPQLRAHHTLPSVVAIVIIASVVPSLLVTLVRPTHESWVSYFSGWGPLTIGLATVYAVYWWLIRTSVVSPRGAALTRIGLVATVPFCIVATHAGDHPDVGFTEMLAFFGALASLLTGKLVRMAAEENIPALFILFVLATAIVGCVLCFGLIALGCAGGC